MSVANPTKTQVKRGELLDSSSARLVLLAPVMLVVAIFLFSPNFDANIVDRSEPFGGDFLQEWVGGHIVLSGESQLLYELDHFRSVQHDDALVGFRWPESKYFPPVYPPFYYAAMSGLALLNYKSAVFVWGLISALAIVLTGELIWRFYRPAKSSFGKLFLASLIFVPLLLCFTMGHKSTLLLLILTGSFLLLKYGRDVAAGAVFGLIAFKPHLAIVIGVAMLFNRNWRFVGGAALTVSILAISSMLVGWQACLEYVQVCLGMGDYVQAGGYQLTQAHSLWGAASNLLPGVDPSWANGLALVGSLAVALMLVRLLKPKFARHEVGFDLQFSGMVVATVLIAPHFYTYDLVVLLLPLMVFATHFLSEKAKTTQDRFLFGVAVAFVLLAGTFEKVAAVTHVQPSVIAMLVTLAVLASAVRVKSYPTSPGSAQNARVVAS